MKRLFIVLLAGFIFTAAATAGQYFYVADFSSPLNQVGESPAAGLGAQTPSRVIFGAPTVVSSFGHLTNQPLLFRGIWYEQIGFDLNRGASDYFLDFYFESHKLNPSLFAFTMLFDCPMVETFDFHGIGGIELPDYSFLDGWTDNELHHMHIVMVTTNRTWTMQFDDRPPVTGSYARASDPDIYSLRLNLSTWYWATPDDPSVQIAIDNVRVGTTSGSPVPAITCPDPVFSDCNTTPIRLVTTAQDSSTSPLQVIWQVDGVFYQTNTFSPGVAIAPTNAAFSAAYGVGEHTVLITASNGQSLPVQCSTKVTIAPDKTPPTITRVDAMPNQLWPPNGKMVPIKIDVAADDNCGATQARIIEVQSDGQSKGGGKNQDNDWQITGPLTVNLRAATSVNGGGRTYKLIVECTDQSGNTSRGAVSVVVSHS